MNLFSPGHSTLPVDPLLKLLRERRAKRAAYARMLLDHDRGFIAQEPELSPLRAEIREVTARITAAVEALEEAL